MIRWLLAALLVVPSGRPATRRVRRLKQILDRRLRQQRIEQIRKRQLHLTRELQALGVKPRYADQRWKVERSRALARLHSQDAGERAAAAWWIGVNEVKGAWRPLVKLLRDPNPTVRANAVFALGRLKVKHMAPAIYDRLDRDASVEVKGRAAVALGRLRYHRALPLIVHLISSDDPRLKLSAVKALGWMGDPSTLGRLGALARSKDDQVRIETARALSRFHSTRAVTILRRMLDDPSPLVASQAVDSLARLGAKKVLQGRLGTLLSRPGRQVRLALVHALVRLGALSAAQSLARLFVEDSPLLVGEAASASARLGAPVPDRVLLNLFAQQDNRILVLAVRTAMHLGARWAIARIRPLLKSPYEPLTVESALALGWLEDSASEKALLGLLQRKSEVIRAAALEALGLVGGPRALAACVVMLSDRAVSGAAARCVGRLARLDRGLALRGVKGLVKLMRHKAPCEEASQAARALGAMAAPDRLAFIRIVRLTLNASPRCRKAAALALGLVKGGARSEAIRVLGRMLDRDGSLGVRAGAALGLGLLGSKESLPVMAALGRRSDLSFGDRFLTVVAMSLLEPGWRSRVTKLFQHHFCGPPVTAKRAEIVDLLAMLHRPWLGPLLHAAEKCDSALVRARARRVLGHAPPEPRKVSSRPKAKPARGAVKRKARSKSQVLAQKKKGSNIAGPFPSPSQDRGCGCSNPGTNSRDLGFWLGGIFLLFLLRTRRRLV